MEGVFDMWQKEQIVSEFQRRKKRITQQRLRRRFRPAFRQEDKNTG